ncbi:MAG: cell wall-active antibiotics response protein [Bacteroidales bacterium]|nr:cell wall-active antibiotics response protein [Bacteroidales bacterium]
MKMGPGLFWGILLVAIGLSIILKVIFNISMFRIIVAILFILIGVRVLISKPMWKNNKKESDTLFNERTVRIEQLDDIEYNTIFGKTVYDFRKVQVDSTPDYKIEFNAIFGHSEIILPDDLYVRIKADAVFAAANMPSGTTAAFGSTIYESEPGGARNKTPLNIEAHAVFGHIDIRHK